MCSWDFGVRSRKWQSSLWDVSTLNTFVFVVNLKDPRCFYIGDYFRMVIAFHNTYTRRCFYTIGFLFILIKSLVYVTGKSANICRGF